MGELIMKFEYSGGRSNGKTKELQDFATLYEFVNTVSTSLIKFYEENEDEEYRQALRDISFDICKYLEPKGIHFNRTPLTASWLDSNERKELRKQGVIK